MTVASAGCRPAPEPLTVDLVGESLTMQSLWERDASWRRAGVGLPDRYDLVVDAFAGFKFETVQSREEARASDAQHPRPSILVIALGINNATTDFGQSGWTTADETAFSRLIGTPSTGSCVVVALPAVGPKASKAYRDHVALARLAMRRIASARRRTVIVDWATTIAKHPEYLGPDGIHLAGDHAEPEQLANPDAADAYGAMLWSGVSRCPAPPA